MLDVYYTIDVEVWCDGWERIDEKFSDAFQRYIYGVSGSFGLPYQLDVLNAHGLKSVCFVEPLFAGRFGIAPLEEVVGLIASMGHEVQLHMHPEWVDEARQPLLPNVRGKRQHLRYYSLDEQSSLVSTGIEWLQRAGADRPTAFRAGSFAFNADTLSALEAHRILVDSSYNASMFGPSSGVCPGQLLAWPQMIQDVLEMPMTVYADGRGLRHAQLTACSSAELEHLLWQALEQQRPAFLILSHNFELLDRDLSKVDKVVVKRLHRLCEFLQRNSDCFNVRGMRDSMSAPAQALSTSTLSSPLWRTAARTLEQAWRRIH